MTTLPRVEVPSRFGGPAEVTAIEWKTFKNPVYQAHILVSPDPKGGFVAVALDLPGVASQGDSIDQAIENIKEAFSGAIEVYLEEGAIPWQVKEVDRTKESLERWILVNA